MTERYKAISTMNCQKAKGKRLNLTLKNAYYASKKLNRNALSLTN